MLWSETQGDMNVDDYVTKVTTHQPRQTSTGPRRIDATSRVNPRSEATHPQLRPAGRRQNDGRSTARRQSRRDGIVRCRHRSIKHPGRAERKQQTAADSVPTAVRQDPRKVCKEKGFQCKTHPEV